MNKSQEIVVLRGLPASGKTTIAMEYVAKGYKRVNKDDLRAMIDGGKWSKGNENSICRVRDAVIEEYLSNGLSVVVDDTNFYKEHVYKTMEIAIKNKAQHRIQDVDTPLSVCLQRDLERGSKVGADVIINMWEKYVRKELAQDGTKPKAVIFDIDGTLSKMEERGPYQYDNVRTDSVRAPVAEVLQIYKDAGYKIIIFTGRDGICEADTKAWLQVAGIKYDHYGQRKEGDTRKDYIVKKEMLDKIRNGYNIRGVYDDRDQVVAMWREEGYQCYQVNYGNF